VSPRTAVSYIAAALGVMAILAVAAFHYPEYLTTPELREVYSEELVRTVLRVGLIIATIAGVLGVLGGQAVRYALAGLACSLLAWIAGGPDVALDGPVRTPSFYVSVDWLLLDLILIATLFLSIERVGRLRPDQPVLRLGWRVDLSHYVVNHLANGVLVVLIAMPARTLGEALDLGAVHDTVAAWPLVMQVVGIMFVTYLAQYWIHRASHRVPLLWRFHAVHHSTEAMDWLAGSRLHVVDIVLTRAGSLVPMTLLGFSNEAINIYLPILALQSVFIHCNVNWPLGALRKLLATPQFHHWHHAEQPVDRNFAVTLPIFDIVFGTYHCPPGTWPQRYGLGRSPYGESYVAHLLKPFGIGGRSRVPHAEQP
jgi:lathosterol oxidase